MAALWQLECVEVLRVLINDMAATPTYDDTRLQRLLVAASLQLVNEVSFDTVYTIDVSKALISPDPSSDSTKDNAFINLLCLKAAAILLNSELRYYAVNSYKIVDGPSTIDVSTRATFVQMAARVMNDKYNQMKILHQCGQAGAAVLTPYTVKNIYVDTRFQ